MWVGDLSHQSNDMMVTIGKQRYNQGSFFLRGPVISIGRSVDSNIVCADDKSTSRNHARLYIDAEGNLEVEDAGPKYGCHLSLACGESERKLDANERVKITSGNSVRFGGSPMSCRITFKKVQLKICETRLKDADDKARLKKALQTTNAISVKNPHEATHVLTSKRMPATVKMLTAIALPREIVLLDWLLSFAETTAPLAVIPPCGDYRPSNQQTHDGSKSESQVSNIDEFANLSQSRSNLFQHLMIIFTSQSDLQYQNLVEICSATTVNLCDYENMEDLQHKILNLHTPEWCTQAVIFYDVMNETSNSFHKQFPLTTSGCGGGLPLSWLSVSSMAASILRGKPVNLSARGDISSSLPVSQSQNQAIFPRKEVPVQVIAPVTTFTNMAPKTDNQLETKHAPHGARTSTSPSLKGQNDVDPASQYAGNECTFAINLNVPPSPMRRSNSSKEMPPPLPPLPPQPQSSNNLLKSPSSTTIDTTSTKKNASTPSLAHDSVIEKEGKERRHWTDEKEAEKEKEEEDGEWRMRKRKSSPSPISSKRRRDEKSESSSTSDDTRVSSKQSTDSNTASSHTKSKNAPMYEFQEMDDDDNAGWNQFNQQQQQSSTRKGRGDHMEEARELEESCNVDIATLLESRDQDGWIKVYDGPLRKKIVEEKRKILLNSADTLRVDQELTVIPAEVIEKPIKIVQEGHHNSHSTSHPSNSCGGRDVRKFRKNHVRKCHVNEMVSLIGAELVLPKETEREAQIRRAHEKEWKDAEKMEMIWQDLPNERMLKGTKALEKRQRLISAQ